MIHAIKRKIAKKFMFAVMATTFLALLLAGTGMLAYDIHTFQKSWTNNLQSQANILARVNAPALEFNDIKVAKENLDQLKVRPMITAAAIYSHDGTLFATYKPDGIAAFSFPQQPASGGYIVNSDSITLFQPIEKDGEHLGTVFLHSQYPVAERIRSYLSILGLIMGLSLLFAALVSYWLQSAVTRPIRALTEAVNQTIGKRDFSMRVAKTTEDETGVLVDAFNIMLAEVGERTRALETSNASLQREMQERIGAEDALRQLNGTLEARILARTADLERAHEQLRQSQKLEAIGQLTGGVAHDFNNVLQVISGNLQLLQMHPAVNPETQRRLKGAAFAADRGAKLASQLLSFARRQPLQPVSTNLGRVLRNMDELLRRALGDSIHIETVVAGGLWNTLVDPNQLENVILNLAINARDAMKEDGKLTLELGNAILDEHYVLNEPDVSPGQYVMLAVSDTGGGMSPEVMARAFEPFYSTKREGEGTGLGLSMAYGFIKQSNGHIRIYSELGNGTTIKIYLPRSHQAEVEMPDVRSGPVVGGAETILVVEDDPIVQATAVDMLSGLGYNVLKAADGQSALTILQSGLAIDLLFTDVVMPGPLRSPELARMAKQLFPDIEVLFTSGYTQNAIVHGGRLDPGVDLISKPYRREDLARKIRHMLANRLQVIAPMPTILQEDAISLEKAASPLRILTVEDNAEVRTILCEVLMALGHRPHGVGDSDAAIQAFSAQKYDVLLTDIHLPGISGIELAKQLVEEDGDLKIIFSSGIGAIGEDEFKHQFASLPKPYDLELLQKVLAKIVANDMKV
ncbi:response regulator [Janthinobacterium sp. 17J80-10]|uniref:response regulator n=1 Tax=Janthinobacterium sp. 17J80-10 TaxID=2497863 RepID=UPI0010058D1A|nr:response regulator [Janthinobacterium sp. 17J80-10]QAU34517.1 response regulator [Janthinobacterium sp. 17J80-10]